MSVGKAGGDLKALGRIAAAGLAAQDPAQGLDLNGRPVGEGVSLTFSALYAARSAQKSDHSLL